jgi:ABC-type sugar transport system substrate-binding protein
MMSSAVIVALLSNHAAADRVRTRLSSGDTAFPTDRVHLTSTIEPGNAGLVPAASFALKLEAYFRTLFDRADEADQVKAMSAAVQSGNGAIAVFPRGDIETTRAVEVLRQAQPLQLFWHDLDKQTLEHAASEDKAPVVSNVVDAVTGAKSSAA